MHNSVIVVVMAKEGLGRQNNSRLHQPRTNLIAAIQVWKHGKGINLFLHVDVFMQALRTKNVVAGFKLELPIMFVAI